MARPNLYQKLRYKLFIIPGARRKHRKAKTIRYYNTLGTESSHPFKGINIMVTTHTDGTTTAVKVLHHH